MEITAKELRSRVGEMLACLDRGEAVTITYRGKARAKLVAIERQDEAVPRDTGGFPAFGMWKDRDDMGDVDAHVRSLRKGRSHAD